jgi:hypothetical protein
MKKESESISEAAKAHMVLVTNENSVASNIQSMNYDTIKAGPDVSRLRCKAKS